MKIKVALITAANQLKLVSGYNVPEARILLAHSLKRPVEYLLINSELALTDAEFEAFNALIERRLRLEPIAYITGYKEFYGLEFEVSKDVLIPRNDSEIMVEAIIAQYRHEQYRNEKNKPLKMLELGCGSGCLAISLLVEIPNLRITAADISIAALEVARRNVKKHKIFDRIDLVQSTWYDKIELETAKKYDAIFSNPPYITPDEIADIAPETLKHEPHIALFDSHKQSSYYQIALQGRYYLKPDGRIFVEIGYKNRQAVEGIFKELGYKVSEHYKDLSGYVRVIGFD